MPLPQEGRLNLKPVRFVVVDSCSTNVGGNGGVVVLLERAGAEGTVLYIVHCATHAMHNALKAALTAFGHDDSRQREDFNTPLVFPLEKCANKLVDNWQEMGMPAGIPRPEKCCTTRWNTYTRVSSSGSGASSSAPVQRVVRTWPGRASY